MTLKEKPLHLDKLDKKSTEYEVIKDTLAIREELLRLYDEEQYEKALQKVTEALRRMRDSEDYSGVEFRAMLAALLFDLAEIHFQLKDYKQSEKELEVLFKVLEGLLKEDRERFGHWHVLALELSTRILRSRRKTLELLAKQQLNTGVLYDKVNSGVAAATDKLVDSLRRVAQMLASTGDYRQAVRFYMEAIKLAKKRAGKMTRREVAMTVEMARAMMHSRSEQDRAKRLLNAVLPHAVALETVELEQEILSMLETIEKNVLHDPKWRTFLSKIKRNKADKADKADKTDSVDKAD